MVLTLQCPSFPSLYYGLLLAITLKEMICVLRCCLLCFFLNQLRFGRGLNLCVSGWLCSVLWVKSCGFASHAWVKRYTLLQLAGGQCALRPSTRFQRVACSLASEPLFLLEYVCVEETWMK